jgi:YrbI family 3-deoxy-D-manno-octulosonate 8-phosphate phosphatase
VRKRLGALRSRLASVRLLAFDVDGVLTDGGIYVGPDGSEWKRFHVRDGLGLVAARKAGLRIAFVSGRRSPAVAARARELGVHADRQGVKDKGEALRDLRRRFGLQRWETLFLGDDLVDLPAFEEAGVSVAVGDSHPAVLARADAVTASAGGCGAAREVVEAVLLAHGLATPLRAPGGRGGRRRA